MKLRPALAGRALDITALGAVDLYSVPTEHVKPTVDVEKSRDALLTELEDRANSNPRYRYWPTKVAGPLLGFRDGSGPIFYPQATHRVVIGGSGRGKGTAVIIPMLLHDDGHAAVVVDPNNGAIARVTAGYRQSLAPTYIIDPYGVTGLFPDGNCDSFNPLASLDSKSQTLVEDAAAIARALCYSPDGSAAGDSAYFDRQAQSFLIALILHLITHPGERATLIRLRELTSMLRDDFDAQCLAPMQSNPACGGTVQRYAAELMQHSHSNDRGFESILSTIRSYTFWCEFQQLRRVTERSTFSFSKVRETGGTVYIVVPDQRMEESASWLRVMMQAARLGLQNSESRRPVHFILDETAAFGKFDLITAGLRAWRSSNLRLHLFFQNVSQIQAAFDKGAGAVTDAEVIQFLGSQEHETLEFVSKLFGERDMITPTENVTFGSSWSGARGQTEGTSKTETTGSGTSASTSQTRTEGESWSTTEGMSVTEGTSSTSSTSTTDHKTTTSRTTSSSHSVSHSTSHTNGGSISAAHGTTQGSSTNNSAATGTSSSSSLTETEGSNNGLSRSYTLQLRRSFRPDELRRMPPDRMAVIVPDAEAAFLFKEHFFRNLAMVLRAATRFRPKG